MQAQRTAPPRTSTTRPARTTLYGSRLAYIPVPYGIPACAYVPVVARDTGLIDVGMNIVLYMAYTSMIYYPCVTRGFYHE